MNNLYRKVAVASVCIVLSFALEPNKEVKAGPPPYAYNFTSTKSFTHIDQNQDGLVDYGYSSPLQVGEGSGGIEFRSFYEFNIAQLLDYPSRIDYARLEFRPDTFGTFPKYGPSFQLEVYGYDSPEGNIGIPRSIFESGKYLGSTRPTDLSFYVIPFIQEKVRNKSAFVGFALRDTYNYKTSSDDEKGIIYLQNEARLSIIAPPGTIAPPEPVPEPTTIFGSAIGIYLGGWLKRKKSTLQNKAKSQA